MHLETEELTLTRLIRNADLSQFKGSTLRIKDPQNEEWYKTLLTLPDTVKTVDIG